MGSPKKTDAQFNIGMVNLTLPKAEEAKARTIAVKVRK
jgi:hypothetical protein